MKKIDSFKLVEFANRLAKLEIAATQQVNPGQQIFIGAGASYDELRAIMQDLGMHTSLKVFDRYEAALNADLIESIGLKGMHSAIASASHELHTCVTAELSTIGLFAFSNKYNDLYANPYLNWDDVLTQWPDAAYDIEHAGKCLALSEWTACVFHLSRIAERGLREACEKYIPPANLPVPPRAMMGIYLQAIETFDPRSGLKPVGAAELTEAATYFRSIKNVWRDNVSHTGVKYDGEEADRIYTAIRGMLTVCAKML